MFSTASRTVQDININISLTGEASLLGSDGNFHTWNKEGSQTVCNQVLTHGEMC